MAQINRPTIYLDDKLFYLPGRAFSITNYYKACGRCIYYSFDDKYNIEWCPLTQKKIGSLDSCEEWRSC